MAFDPNQPFTIVEEEEVGFDPTKPFSVVEPSGTSFGEEVSQLGSAFVESIGRPLENMGESFDAIGFTGVANALKDVIREPEGYVSASQRFMEPNPDEAQFMGFAWQYAPRAAVEQVGQAIGAMGTRAVGAAAGGVVGGPAGAVAGGFAGPAIFGAAQVIGPVAKERAKNNGREVPNNEDLVAATLTAIGSGSLDAIGARYLPGGEKATGKFFKRVASSFVGEGLLTEAPQSVIEQVGATAGTEKGLNINVKQAVGEGLLGGTSAAGLSAVVYPLTKKEEPDPKKKVIRTPEEAEELDIDAKSNEEAVSLMGEPADQAQNERITKLKEIESVIANNETLMTGLEPNAPERTQLDLENKAARKEADKLKAEISKSVGLSLPITTSEQQQIELARQIARKPAQLGAMPSPSAQTAEATYGAATGVYDVFGGVRRKPAPTVKEGLTVPPVSMVGKEVIPGVTPVPEVFGKLPTAEVETGISQRAKEAKIAEEREKIEAPIRRQESINQFISEGAIVKSRTNVVGRKKAAEGGGDITKTTYYLAHPDGKREISLSKKEASDLRPPVSETITEPAAIVEQEPVAPAEEAEFAELNDLMERRGQAQSKVKGVKFSKKDEARLKELFPKYRSRFIETVTPESDPVVWKDIEGNDIKVSQKGTFYTVRDGRVRTGVAFQPEEFVTDVSPQPVSAAVVESNNVPLPEGYTKQGDVYVYQAPAPVTTPAPAETPAAPAPAVAEAKPPKVGEIIAIDRKNNTEFALVKGLLPERPDMFSIGIRLIGSTQPFESGGYGHNTNKDRIMQRFFEKERTRLKDIEIQNQYFQNILSEEESKVSKVESAQAAEKTAQEEQQRVFNEKKTAYEDAVSKVKLPTGKSETMRFVGTDGSEQALESTRYGNIGIRKVTSGKKPLYNVDHWPSGLRFTQVASLSEAKKLAQAIIASEADISSKDIPESELNKLRPVVRYFKGGDVVPELPAAPTPAAPAAEPAGISVGNRIKLGNSPQTYTIEEVIPQTEAEKELGEQYYSVKNEKTGEVQTVEAKDIKIVKGKGVRKMAAQISPEQDRLNERMKNIPPHSVEIRNLYGNTEISIYGSDDLSNPKVTALVTTKENSIQIDTIEASAGGKGKGYGKAIYLYIARLAQDNFKDYITGSSSEEAIGVRNSLFPTITEQQDDLTFSTSEISPELNYTPQSFIEPYDNAGKIIPLEERFQPTSPDIRREAATRVKDESLVIPEGERYTFEQAQAEATKLFGGMPEGFIIVNDSVDKEFEFKAGYEPDTGNIILNLAYIRQGESVRNLIAHELGHYAAGNPEIRAKLQEFLDALPPATRAKLERFVEKVYNDETGDIRLEEKQVRAFVQMLKTGDQRNAFQKLLDAIKKWLNDNLGTNFQPTDMDAAAVLSGAINRFVSGEKIAREDGEMREARVERYDERSQVASVEGIGAIKDTPKGINKKTETIIRDRVFDAAIVNDNQTKKAWNLIQKIEDKNPDAGKNAQAINELTRETMQDVEADEVVKQTIGAVKLRNELYAYAIKLAGDGDTKMLNYLLNTRLSIGSGSIVEGDAGRLLQAMKSLKSWIVTATEAEQAGFFNIAAQQFFDTKNPTDEQVQKIKDIFFKVKSVKIDQEKELMTELEEVGTAAGVDLPAVIQKQVESAPGLDPMVVAITNMLKMGGTFIYRPTKNKIGEAVKNTISRGITNYRKKIVSKAANGLETGFWKTLSSTEQKPGPLGELDAAQNKALGNIVKQSLIKMGLKGTPPDTKMSIYEQVASILGEQPLSQDKIKLADEKIRGGIEAKRQTELENAAEDQIDAINLKYDGMIIAWDDAMSRMLDMPVSETMLRRMILNELKEADTSIQDIAKLMEEEPVIGASRQDRYVESIIEKILGSGRYLTRINAQGKPEADYTNLKTYLSSLLENMVLARQQKNKAAKDTAKLKRDAGGDPDKQAQAQIDKLAKVQADPTIFGEKRVDPVRNVVRDALALQLNIGFTPEQSAKIKAGWKGAFVADPNKKGLPSSFMLELQRLGVSESAANTLADIVWRQIEINALSRQMDATTKAVEAGPIGGIVQAILDTPLANQQDPEWRKKVIVDYLKNAGVKPSQAENIAKLFDISLRKRFAKAQEEAAIKAAKSIEGGLTTNSRRALEKFLKAIRAQVLDPGKDVAKAFAEEMGWKGFTSEQIVRLNELDAIVNDNEKTDAEIAVALEQIQQIIDKVSAPPQIKEILGSFYIGNALMRFPTFSIQQFDPLAITAFNTAIESFRNITNPQQFIQTWADYGRAIANMARETVFSFRNDVGRSGRMIDYIENEDRKIKRLADEAVRKFKAGDIRGAMKDGLFGYTAFTFRTLKALDDGAYSLLTSTTLPQYVEAALKNAKIPREKRRGVMRQVLEAREMDIKRMVAEGVSKNDAVVYANERMQAAITKELSGLNINAQEVINSAINDSLARIGKTRFTENILTGKTEEIKDLGTISAPFLRWYESVSKSVSGSGSEAQKIFYRILLGFPLIPARIFNIAAGYTPLTIYRHALKSRYSLTYGTALQRRQRLAEQLAGTMVLLPLLALRSNSTDEEDEKEKGFGVYITGQGPSKMKDKTLHAKWNDRHDPFSLEFRMGGKTKFSIDAKAAGPLSVMIYLLGAMDDWETNRKLDGLKTSKDDWKEAQDNASIFTSLYDLAGYAVLTTARRGPTTGVMQGLVDFRRFPDDPIAAIGADVAFSAMPAVPILGTGIAKNLSDFLSQPIDNTTKEGAILANIPIVGPIAGKPALNSYGQRIGELRVSEKLKKSFGVPFTLVVSDSEEDNKLTSLTLKFGDGPTPLRREDVENELRSAISDEEWYLAAKTFGDRNRSYVLKNYNRYEKMKPAGFSKLMSTLGKASKANAIAAVKKARRKNP